MSRKDLLKLHTYLSYKFKKYSYKQRHVQLFIIHGNRRTGSFTLQTGMNFAIEHARDDKRLDQSQVFNLFASISEPAGSYDHGLNHNEYTYIDTP